jgi:hypothetical protein
MQLSILNGGGFEKWGVPACVFVVEEACSTCGCGKLETCGLPCSHICAVLKKKDELAYLSGLIGPRWVIDERQRHEARLAIASAVKGLEVPLALRDQSLCIK